MKLKDIFTPKVLSGLAVAGVVGTAVLAAVEAMSSKDEIAKIKDEIPEEKKDSKLAVSAHYIPRVAGYFKKTIVVGGVTIACVVASCYLSGLQLAAMAGTVSYLVSQRTAIEKEVSKLPGGKEAIDKAKKEVAKLTADKELEKEKIKRPLWQYQSIEDTGYGDDLFLDEWSGRLFLSSEKAVREGFDKFNEERDEGMDLPFSDDSDMNLPLASPYNDLFIKWNIATSGIGHQFGYPASDDYYVHRSIPYTIEIIPVEEMKDKTLQAYGKDLHIIKIPYDYYPMESYLEL